MANGIEKRLQDFGFSEAQASEIFSSLCQYVELYGRRWKAELGKHWAASNYPPLNESRAALMQTVKASAASQLVTRLTAQLIKAERATQEG